MKKILLGIFAIVFCIVIAGCGNKQANNQSNSGTSNSGPEAYLPKNASEYDTICYKNTVSNGNVIDEAVGVRKFDNYNYVSFSMVYVISKQDGTPIEQTEENIQNAEDTRKGIGTTATVKFDNGKVIINHGTSDYSITDIATAKQTLASNGYSCN